MKILEQGKFSWIPNDLLLWHVLSICSENGLRLLIHRYTPEIFLDKK